MGIENAGLIGGIVGSVVGILGGVVGTYFSIHNTRTHAERRFMVIAAVWMWLFVLAFLTVLFLLPLQWQWVAWLPYVFALPMLIRYMNHRAADLRNTEERVADPTGKG